MTSESVTPANLPARQQINFPRQWRGRAVQQPYLHSGVQIQCQIQNRGRVSEGRRAPSSGGDDDDDDDDAASPWMECSLKRS